MRVDRMSIIVVNAPEVGADSTSWDLLTQKSDLLARY